MQSIKKFNLDDGTFIRYTEQGSGQPLLLLHTIRNRLEYSDELLPYLTKKFKVYVIDLPGHGDSPINKKTNYDQGFLTNSIVSFIEDLNLKNFLNKKTGELSSGQKNRVSLAKSLINKPKLLFLDEPTASLDPDVGDFVREYLEIYKSKNELTMLLASHNMREVERLCNTVVMMKKGTIVDKGTCKELIDKHGRNNLEETFLKIARSNNEMA